MSIIFYEYEYCQKIIDRGAKTITQRDLNYLAKYWEYEGIIYSQIQKNIENFCLKNDKNFNLIRNFQMITRALSHAKNNNIRFPTPIIITQAEINIIRSIDDYIKEKFLFSMLVCAKFFKNHPSKKHIKRGKYDNTLYSNNSIKDIQDISRIKFTKKEWYEWKYEFTTKALITPTIFDDSCWAIGFQNENSEPCFIIEDYRNIIAYYQEYCGEIMINCSECGVKTAKRSNRHFMCADCSKEKRRIVINNNAKKYYMNKILYK